MFEEFSNAYEVRCIQSVSEMLNLTSFGFDVFLYLQPQHVALQVGPDLHSFILVEKRTEQVVGLSIFFIQDHIAYTPWRAPFGGIQMKSIVEISVGRYFIKHIISALRQINCKTVNWIQCPDAYALKVNSLLKNELLSEGFTLQYDQINHHIPVSEKPFLELLHSSARRRLNKCLNEGYKFQKEDIYALPEAYSFLKLCRDEKQKPLSLTLAQLQRYFDLFPDRYFLFTVKKGSDLAAVGIAVQINSYILNHLYPASLQKFNPYSPSILLNAGLYQFCQERKITMLDLGVSAPVHEDEIEYEGLIKFKARLGGIVSRKPTFTRLMD